MPFDGERSVLPTRPRPFEAPAGFTLGRAMKRTLQKLVVRTNFPPFIWFYRLCYAASLRVAVSILRRQRSLTTAYLISSMAARDIVYGLSDIDLILIIDDERHKDEVTRAYKRLSRLIPLVKYDEMGLYSLEEVRRRYAQRGELYLKYKLFTECKKQGRLLFGVDILAEFAELEGQERDEYILGQLAFTWSVFLKSFVVAEEPRVGVMRNYLCYKITSDMCKAYVSARWQKEIFNRRDALTYAKDSIDNTQRLQLERVQALARRGFAGEIPGLVDTTFDFCVHIARTAAEHLASLRAPRVDTDLQLDVEETDLLLAEANVRNIHGMLERIRAGYGQYVRSMIVANRDILYNSLLNEHHLCILVIPEAQLPFEAVKGLNASLKAERSPQQLHLYLLSPPLALSLNRYDREQIQASVVPLQWIDRAILQYLCTPTPVVFGKPPMLAAVGKRDLLDWVLPSKSIISRFIASNEIVRLSALQFQVFFWEALHLKLLLRAVETGQAVPLISSRQLCRQYKDRLGFDPGWLEGLHDEYRKDLNDLPSATESYFPRAAAALRQLYGDAT